MNNGNQDNSQSSKKQLEEEQAFNDAQMASLAEVRKRRKA
jgi:hypothetical protein